VANPSSGQQPNVLLIITDQQRADHLGCAGHPTIKTPHIDSLARVFEAN
jgi:arylsulfatase A-like enzyme